MASVRAQEVAELLWELKRAEKLGTYTMVARRAGFSPGVNGRTMLTVMKTVRRDWPHLQWWRAVPDDGTIETGCELAELLQENAFPLSEDGENSVIADLDSYLMVWEEEEEAAEAAGE
jgi:alkylated DNA nucleotide flippase Atl1